MIALLGIFFNIYVLFLIIAAVALWLGGETGNEGRQTVKKNK